MGDVREPVLGVSQSLDSGTSYVFSSKGCSMIPKSIEHYNPDAVKLLRENDLFFLDTDGFGDEGNDDDKGRRRRRQRRRL